MTMTQTDVLGLCDCCALMLANGDESGCRDYHGHEHPSIEVPVHTVLTDESDQPVHGFVCDGCHTEQGAFAYRLWATVLTSDSHDAHDSGDSHDSEEREHRHEYRGDLADWWCWDCSTVTDFCTKLSPR